MEAVHQVAHTKMAHQPVAIHQVIIVVAHIEAVVEALVVAEVHALAVAVVLVAEVPVVAVLALVAAVDDKPFIP